MGAATPPEALLEATAELIAARGGLADQLDTGLRALLRLVGADRGDAGFVASSATAYRPNRLAAVGDTPVGPFEVPTSDPLVRHVLAEPAATRIGDVVADLPAGPTRDLLVGSGTGSIVVRRLDRGDDGAGLVCLDWVDRTGDPPAEVLELVDFFVARIWSPLLMRTVAERSRVPPPDPLAGLTSAERSVVELAAEGLSYREIALRRCTSVNTIGQQLRSARTKVGARNTAELCALVGPGPSVDA